MKYLSKFYLPTNDEYNESNDKYYPYNVFCDKHFSEIVFDDITIFYGNNGSGKSTLLNIIIKKLNKKQEVIKASRVKKKEIEKPEYEKYRGGFNSDNFSRQCETELMLNIPVGSELISSEDIFNYILQKRIDNEKKELERKRLDDDYWFANSRSENAVPISAFKNDMERYLEIARLRSAKSSKKLIESRVEKNEKELSNGQTSLDYYNEKIKENRLYFLDEPENSLAPEYQLELAKLIIEMSRFFKCQFVIATHSPFILALPYAKIYDLDATPVKEKKWYELENMKIYYDFFKSYKDKFEENE